MKAVQGSDLRKLIPVKLDSKKKINPQKPEAEKTAPALEESLRPSFEHAREAAHTLVRVAGAKPKEVSSQSAKEQEELRRAAIAASESRVEDVDKFAQSVAERIRDNPKQAMEAQANLGQKTVNQLVR
jgi:hypothetical protein